MSRKDPLDKDDLDLFRTLMGDTRRLRQDTVLHPLAKKNERALPQKRLINEQVDNSHYFSDEYQPLLAADGPVRYTRSDVSPYEVKKLRRGDYTPEIFLDLHGLTQQQAKKELGAMIAACRRERLFCASVMHGHGKHILKQQTPLWLAQHPHVMAFHQAPKMFGGNAAILMLIEVDELAMPLF